MEDEIDGREVDGEGKERDVVEEEEGADDDVGVPLPFLDGSKCADLALDVIRHLRWT